MLKNVIFLSTTPCHAVRRRQLRKCPAERGMRPKPWRILGQGGSAGELAALRLKQIGDRMPADRIGLIDSSFGQLIGWAAPHLRQAASFSGHGVRDPSSATAD